MGDEDQVTSSVSDHQADVDDGIMSSPDPIEDKSNRNSVSKVSYHSASVEEPELKYPKSVFFIVVNEFCERFTFYGLRTLLAVYCNKVLHYSVDTATVIYHTFVAFAYFTPLFGAFIADSFLGKFKTIIYLSIVYAIGNCTLTLASVDTAIEGMPTRAISILGLVIIAIGTGGIKPCVSAFGGDQFIVPQQQKQVETFFSIFYFAVNSGSFVSTFVTPILREDVHCFGKDSCYPLAYGVPAILMFIAIGVFLLGKRWYIIKKPDGNIVAETLRVIGYALKKKRKSSTKKDHWLDYATEKFGERTVSDIKATLKVAFLFIPLPMFWALYDQQGSRWTFQASRMNGAIGGFTLQAEQMQVVNPILILLLVPLFEVVIYPLFAKCNFLTQPLLRLGIGGTLAGVSFLISAGVEMALEPTYAVVPQVGEGQLRFFNGFDCPITVKFRDDPDHIIKGLEMWELKHLGVTGFKDYTFTAKLDPTCKPPNILGEIQQEKVTVMEKASRSYLISYDENRSNMKLYNSMTSDNVEKTDDGRPKLRFLYHFQNPERKTFEFISEDGKTSVTVNATDSASNYVTFDIETYNLKYGDQIILKDFKLDVGGVYTLMIQEDSVAQETFDVKLNVITEPNSVHMMWLLPQYIVMTVGEVMFSVSGLQFSFTQAPVTMKSLLTSAWLMTNAVGNVIVAIIAGAKIFDKQKYEFLLFAGIMFVDMVVFAAMAWGFEYVDPEVLNHTNELPLDDRKGIEDLGMENKTSEPDEKKKSVTE